MSGLLALLLLTAASLKLAGSDVSPYAQYGWLSSPWVTAVAVLWELVLGLWLLSGMHRFGAWAAAVGTFAAFAAISGYLGWIGQASCGCFGMVQASPWHAFAVDATALALLAIFRPDRRSDSSRLPTGFVRMLLGAAVLLAATGGTATLVYGSPAAALARLQGVPLFAPGYVDFGAVTAGEAVNREVPVTNWTDTPVRLIGGTTDCSCLTTANMPLTIGPGETVSVTVQLKVPGAASGSFTRRVELWTDCDRRRTIALRVGCRAG